MNMLSTHFLKNLTTIQLSALLFGDPVCLLTFSAVWVAVAFIIISDHLWGFFFFVILTYFAHHKAGFWLHFASLSAAALISISSFLLGCIFHAGEIICFNVRQHSFLLEQTLILDVSQRASTATSQQNSNSKIQNHTDQVNWNSAYSQSLKGHQIHICPTPESIKENPKQKPWFC